jgi:D-alanyl-D-alanine-carboxypeptidase/D-alanyl-D-alanine-endopeptidase
MTRCACAAIVAALVLFCLGCMPPLPTAPSEGADPAEWLDYETERYIAAAPRAAIVACLVLPDGSELVRARGLDARGKAADERTLFEIGSITKTFTGLLLASMDLEGLVSRADPLSMWLPADVAAPRFDGVEPTLEDLACHGAGFPDLPPNIEEQEGGFDHNNPYLHYDEGMLFAAVNSLRLEWAPLSRLSYSNFGYGLLGRILALRAGTSYGEAVKQRLLAELGMDDTGTEPSAAQRERLAVGTLLGRRPTSYWHFGEGMTACGSLISSARDMLRYLRANMGLGPSSLDSAITLAHAPVAKDDEVGGLSGTSDFEIGLGWLIESDSGDTLYWHNGGTGGFTSFIGFYKDAGVGVIVLASANLYNPATQMGYRLLQKIR